jgi:hypothetical protein
MKDERPRATALLASTLRSGMVAIASTLLALWWVPAASATTHADACQPDFAHPGMCLSPPVPWEPNPPGDLPGGVNLPPQPPAPRGGCPLRQGCQTISCPPGMVPTGGSRGIQNWHCVPMAHTGTGADDDCLGNGYTSDGRKCGP